MPDITLKRFENPHTLWVLKEPKSNHAQFATKKHSGLTPWIGRTCDLHTLNERLAQTLTGTGHCVVVKGHAGIGKSRLVYEFRRTLAPLCQSFLGNCQAAGHDVAYLPVLESIKQALALNADLSSDELHGFVIASILDLDLSLAVYLPHLFYLLAIPSTRFAFDSSVPDDTLRAEFELALIAVLTGLARRQALVLIFEDWQEVDEASWVFVRRFIETLEEYPILLVIVTRPTLDHAWAERTNLTVVNLDPLSCDDSLEILKAVVSAAELPKGLADFIYQRTEGNPLFIEELARELLDSTTLVVQDDVARIDRPVDESTLPLSVQAAVENRILTLEYFSREALMMASVIGRTFDQDLLLAISPTPQVMSDALKSLMAHDLVYREDLNSPREYRFKHVVVQEVAYRILTLKRRKVIHHNVARTIERLYDNRITEYYEQLAFHCGEAGIVDKPIDYLGYAAQRSVGLVMIAQAIDQYRTAIA